MSKAQQRKGAVGERELAALLRGFGYDVERGGSLSFGEVPDLSGLPGIHIEVKRCEQLRLSEWLAQAVQDSESSFFSLRFMINSIHSKETRSGYLLSNHRKGM